VQKLRGRGARKRPKSAADAAGWDDAKKSILGISLSAHTLKNPSPKPLFGRGAGFLGFRLERICSIIKEDLNVPSMPAGTLYRGKVGMWSWVLHRITGVAIFFFLLVHVLDTALVRLSPEAYNAVISTYKTPLIGVAELGLVAAILYHALNGLRVILIDFWRKGVKYQNVMWWVVVALSLLVFIGFAPRHLSHVFG
jgi:succinate dehydrogenase / fumarate reductase cytochrome b subunit